MPFDDKGLLFGDIVLVPFPFTDQTTTKKRPSVVISSTAYNSARPDIILMAITSQLRAIMALGEVWLTEWQAAGLLKPSTAKPVIATIERSLVIKKLGALATTDKEKLRVALRQIIDLE
jgi:mRNA interferase MazF